MKYLKRVALVVMVSAFAKAHAQEYSQTRRVSDDGVVTESTQKVSKEQMDELRKKFMDAKARQNEKIGSPLGDFSLVDMAGKPITSEDLKGKVSVINFWYKECKPCIQEMPELNELVAQYEGKEVQFIAFCTTGSSKLEGFFDKHPFQYRQIADARAYASDQDVMMFPTNVVLDKAGNITYLSSGYGGDIGEVLEAEINKILK